MRSGNTLTITGNSVAHVILRWRFTNPQSVTLNGANLPIKPDANNIPTVEFDYTGNANIAWK